MKNFNVNDYVKVTALVGNNSKHIIKSFISATKQVSGTTLYQVEEGWYKANDIEKTTPTWFAPTDEEMRLIKAEYPIFKKGNIKVFFESGKMFGFHYEKNGQEGNIIYKGTEFAPMLKSMARKYGF